MKALSNRGFERFSRYLEQVADANNLPVGVDAHAVVARNFAVEPSVQQVLVDKLGEDTSFLSSINIELVPELKGEKLGLGLDGKIVSSRTDVTAAPRVTKSLWALDDDKYECRDTHFDTHLTYANIDRWAKFDDFEARIGKFLLEAQRADRIKIGFNGKAHVPNTDRDANPLGEDVNVGWLERLRLNAPQRVVTAGKVAGEVSFGAGGDFKNLDALVASAIAELIDPWHQNRNDIVVLISRDLLGDKYFDIYNSALPPSEQLATQAVVAQRRVGGHQAATPPWFPKNTVAATFLKNLSIYEQEGSRRRKIDDNAARSRYDNFESFNEDYVVEDYGAMAMVENIKNLDAVEEA